MRSTVVVVDDVEEKLVDEELVEVLEDDDTVEEVLSDVWDRLGAWWSFSRLIKSNGQ